MPTCIYCLEDKPLTEFENPDHVIPQAFGKFDTRNLTLHCVCHQCNHDLGKVENDFATDSLEGHLRYLIGGKDRSEYRHLGKRTLTERTINHPQHGKIGVHLKPHPKANDLVPVPILPIGLLLKESQEIRWFSLENLPSIEELKASGEYDLGAPNALLVTGPEPELLGKQLEKLGWVMQGPAPISDDSEFIEVETKYVTDAHRFRAIAKVAFNYLAYTQGHEMALRTVFDRIRAFIFTGQGEIADFAEQDQEPVLFDERNTDQRKKGHILTIEKTANGRSVLATVTFYNNVRWKICLAKDPSASLGIRSSGHFFHTDAGVILDMFGVDLSKLPEAE